MGKGGPMMGGPGPQMMGGPMMGKGGPMPGMPGMPGGPGMMGPGMMGPGMMRPPMPMQGGPKGAPMPQHQPQAPAQPQQGGSLNAAALAAAPPQVQKQMLGEKLF